MHPEGPAADRPVLHPAQRLPGDRLGRVGPLLQNLRRPGVFQRKSHSWQTGAPVPGGGGGGVPASGGVGAVRASRGRRPALRHVSSSSGRGEESTAGGGDEMWDVVCCVVLCYTRIRLQCWLMIKPSSMLQPKHTDGDVGSLSLTHIAG